MGLERNNLQKGATLVEFAVVLPLLLVLIFGILESARIVAEFTTVRTAAREGARFATTVDDSSGLPNYANCLAILDAARSKAVVGELTSIQVSWESPDGYTFTCSDSGPTDPDPNQISSGTVVSVTVTSTFDAVVPLIEVFLDGITLDSTQSRQVFKGVIKS